jgi:hypothetical protein
MKIVSPFEGHRLSPLRPQFQPVVEPPAAAHPAESHEKKTPLAERLKRVASGIIATIAVEQGATLLASSGPAPAIAQTIDTSQTKAPAQQPAHLQQTTGLSDRYPTPIKLFEWSGPTPVLHFTSADQPEFVVGTALPGGGLLFPNGSLLQTSNDPIDRIVTSISAAQPQPVPPTEAGELKKALDLVYHDIIDVLQNHEKMAQIIAEASVSKTVELAIEKLPECASAILITLGLKKRKNKEATPSLEQTTADLERINGLYVEGVPLTMAAVQSHLGISAARARAALQAGLYMEEWHPVGVSLVEPPTNQAAPGSNA